MAFRRTAVLFAEIVVTTAAVMATISSSVVDAQSQRKAQTAPETFTSPMQARTDAGAAASTVRIQIDRYTPEADRKAMTDALKSGEYPAFL